MTTESFLALPLVVFCLSIPASAQKDAKTSPKTKPEHFAAVAYLPRATARTASHVDFRVATYSSDAEAQELAGLLIDGGSDAAMKVLEKKKTIGSIRLSHRVGFYDFKLIRSIPTENGRRITAVGDRPIGFLEAYNMADRRTIRPYDSTILGASNPVI